MRHFWWKRKPKTSKAKWLNYTIWQLSVCISCAKKIDGGHSLLHRKLVSQNHHDTTTVLRPFFRDHPGELVPEENFWTSWCKGRLTETDTPTIRLSATPSGPTSAHLHRPPFFYRPDALPADQPTVSTKTTENENLLVDKTWSQS